MEKRSTRNTQTQKKRRRNNTLVCSVFALLLLRLGQIPNNHYIQSYRRPNVISIDRGMLQYKLLPRPVPIDDEYSTIVRQSMQRRDVAIVTFLIVNKREWFEKYLCTVRELRRENHSCHIQRDERNSQNLTHRFCFESKKSVNKIIDHPRNEFWFLYMRWTIRTIVIHSERRAKTLIFNFFPCLWNNDRYSPWID